MQGGYQWSITFIDQRIGNTGDVNAMVGTTKNTLKGRNAMVTVCTDGNSTAPCQGHSIMGNQIGGYFEIGVTGQSQKVNISFDATPSKVQTELETLPGVGSLNVQRTVHPDPQRGYIWTVSFVGDEGDTADLADFFHEMQKNEVEPDMYTYTILANKYLAAGRNDDALELMQEIFENTTYRNA